MDTFVDYDLLVSIFQQLFRLFSESALGGGLLIGASLELLGYGIFKAVSLINIKY